MSICSIPLAVRDGDEIPRTSTIWNMLYADDAVIECRSPASLVKMMTAVLGTETMIIRPSQHAQEGLEIVAEGQR